MQALGEMYPEKNPFALADPGRPGAFDRAAGSDSVRILFTKRIKYADVKPFLEKDIDGFRQKAKKYLLY